MKPKMKDIRFLHVLDRSLWHLYEFLGPGIKLNLFFILLFIPLITIPAGICGLLYALRVLGEKKEVHFKDYFSGIKKYGFYGTIFIGGLTLTIALLLLVGIPFYSAYMGKLGSVLAVVTCWVILMLLAGSIYVLELLVRGNSLWGSVRFSFLFFMSHPLYTLLLFVICFFIGFLGAGLILPFIVIIPFAMALLVEEATDRLIAAYRSESDKKDRDDDFRQRTIKKMIKPWE